MGGSKLKDSVSKEVYEKTKVLTLRIFCFSVVMFFSAFISAYVVQSSAKVWVEITPPPAFVLSTVLVILGSIFLILAKKIVKNGKRAIVNGMLLLALLSGVGFAVSQVRGWQQLLDGGNYFVASIINPVGQYNSIFHFEKNGEAIDFNGENYTLNGEVLTEDEVEKLKGFAFDACGGNYSSRGVKMNLESDWAPYTISNKDGKPVIFNKDFQSWETGIKLNSSERQDLFDFSLAVHYDMEYFKLTGKYGEDFVVLLNKEKLDFDKGKFYYKKIVLKQEELELIESVDFDEGQAIVIKGGALTDTKGNNIDVSKGHWDFPYTAGKVEFSIVIDGGVWTRLKSEISPDDYSAIAEASNKTSSYFWLLITAHLIHVYGGLIYLIVLFIMGLNKRFTPDNHLKIRLGGIYWHVLGGLWVFLFFFFQYYH
jgi:heme/copper-type cytochrome/quinol oxidase subunit 3